VSATVDTDETYQQLLGTLCNQILRGSYADVLANSNGLDVYINGNFGNSSADGAAVPDTTDLANTNILEFRFGFKNKGTAC